jgi:hypothetical protein
MTPYPHSRRNPQAPKNAPGMENSHARDSEDNEGSLEDHKGSFIVGQFSVEAVPELGYAVGGPDEYKDCGDEETFG